MHSTHKLRGKKRFMNKKHECDSLTTASVAKIPSGAQNDSEATQAQPPFYASEAAQEEFEAALISHQTERKDGKNISLNGLNEAETQAEADKSQ